MLICLLDVLTHMRQIPIIIRPRRAASHRPIRCPKGPNKLVPIRYEILAGKNVTPCFHRPADIVSIIHIGNEGSNIAIPVFANVIAPVKINQCEFKQTRNFI